MFLYKLTSATRNFKVITSHMNAFNRWVDCALVQSALGIQFYPYSAITYSQESMHQYRLNKIQLLARKQLNREA